MIVSDVISLTGIFQELALDFHKWVNRGDIK